MPRHAKRGYYVKSRPSLLGRHFYKVLELVSLWSNKSTGQQLHKLQFFTNTVLQYEVDGIAKIEEYENTKLKLQARLSECEGTSINIRCPAFTVCGFYAPVSNTYSESWTKNAYTGTMENLNSKFIQLDKSKNALQQEIEQTTVLVDQASLQNNKMEKKIKQ